MLIDVVSKFTIKSPKSTDAITLIAKMIGTEHGNGTVPVSLDLIAKNLSLEVHRRTGASFVKHGWTAMYQTEVRDGLARSSIHLNTDEVMLRQRFALAHAIGHHVLGHGSRVNFDRHYRSNVEEKIQNAANHFALALLMPERSLRQAIGNGYRKTIEGVAEAFQVAPAAMQYRLNYLRLDRLLKP